MKGPNEALPPPRPRMHETFRPGHRASFMAQAILDEIGQDSPFPPRRGLPTELARWRATTIIPMHYQLLKFNLGESGAKYHFDVLTPDNLPLARYLIYHRGSATRIAELDLDGKELDLETSQVREVNAKVLDLLTNCIPHRAGEILDHFINEEFNALIGRFIISDYALELDGHVPKVQSQNALHAAEAHRQYYDAMMDMYESPRTEDYTEDGMTVSFEASATRAATEIGYKWRHSINRNTPPNLRIPRSS